jgi:hypothetical protein
VRAGAIALLLVIAASPALARDSLGVFDGWAAFRDPATQTSSQRCYAIAETENGAGGYATVGFWPQARVRAQVHIGLPRAMTRGTGTLSIGTRRFIMMVRGRGMWARDARMDAAIVAAMRGERSMTASAGGWSGRWVLAGAATAIDAAALGCARG